MPASTVAAETANPWSPNELRMLKHMMERDGIQFMRYFFRLREGRRLILNWHHHVIQYVLQAVLDCRLSRLIINIAPGYTKTAMAVLNFIARGLALNPQSKYIHSSYSADLAQENSAKIKETILSTEYRQLWPMDVRIDTKGKRRWYTEQGGGMMAAAAGGQITGFHAGYIAPGFTGALIIDDPLKPGDAYSQVKRVTTNDRVNNTMRSRLAVDSVPVIVIAQRIHSQDMTGFLLTGGSGDMWHHLAMPAILTPEDVDRDYKAEFTHGVPVDVNGVLRALRGGDEYAF